MFDAHLVWIPARQAKPSWPRRAGHIPAPSNCSLFKDRCRVPKLDEKSYFAKTLFGSQALFCFLFRHRPKHTDISPVCQPAGSSRFTCQGLCPEPSIGPGRPFAGSRRRLIHSGHRPGVECCTSESVNLPPAVKTIARERQTVNSAGLVNTSRPCRQIQLRRTLCRRPARSSRNFRIEHSAMLLRL